MSKLTTIGELGNTLFREIRYHDTVLHIGEFVMVKRSNGNFIGVITTIEERHISISVPIEDYIMWGGDVINGSKKLTPCIELKPGTVITQSNNVKFDGMMRDASIPGATWVFEGGKSILITNPWLDEKQANKRSEKWN